MRRRFRPAAFFVWSFFAVWCYFKNMKFKLIVLALLFPVTVFARDLSLNEALSMADTSPRMEASSAQVDAAKGKLMQVNGAFMPQINVSETYHRTDDPVGVFAAKLQQAKFTAADFNIDRLNHPNGINNWITRAEIAQPIIHSGVDISRRRSADHAFDAAKKLHEFDRQGMRLKVTNIYNATVALREKLSVLDRGIELLKSLEATYEQAEAPTSANATNFLVARSVRTGLEAERLRTKVSEESSRRSLAALIGLNTDEEINLTSALPRPAGFESSSGKKRPDVLAAELQMKSAAAAHRATKWSWGPNLDAFAAYNRYTGDFSSSSGSYEAGVMLSLPVFNGPRFGNIKEAEAQRLAAERLYRATTNESEADLANAEQRAKACVEQYKITEDAAKTADEALRLARQRYQEGTLPLLDYSQTIQNWSSMQQRLIDARYSSGESKSWLAYQTGDL